MTFECAAVSLLQQRHEDLFTPHTDTMPSFLSQQDRLGVLNYMIDCSDLMKTRHYCYDLAQVISRIVWPKVVKFFFFSDLIYTTALFVVMQVVFSWHNFGAQLLPDPAANREGPSLDILQVPTQAFVMRCYCWTRTSLPIDMLHVSV